jgi:hypothetical protein
MPGDDGGGPDMDGARKEAERARDCWANDGGVFLVGDRGATSSLSSSSAVAGFSTLGLDSGSGVGEGWADLSSFASPFFSDEEPALAFWDFFFISAT